MENVIKETDLVLEENELTEIEVRFKKPDKNLTLHLRWNETPCFKEIFTRQEVLREIEKSNEETLSHIIIKARSETEGKVYECDVTNWVKDNEQELIIKFIEYMETLAERKARREQLYKHYVECEKGFKKKIVVLLGSMVFIIISLVIISLGGYEEIPELSYCVKMIKLLGPITIIFILISIIFSVLRFNKSGGTLY